MIKLYQNASNPGQWVAYGPGMGWVVFPAQENGWDLRRTARGLDPMHLREVPLYLAANTGIPPRVPIVPLEVAAFALRAGIPI